MCDGHDVPAWIHPADRDMLADPLRGLSPQAKAAFGGPLTLREPREVRPLDDGAALELAGLTLRVDHTPGHTQGSVIFSTPTAEGVDVIFAGDTLFAGSIGRTDLPGGDSEQMMASLRDTILTRDDSAVVLPGHGPTTTIGRERASNPFLQDLDVPGPGTVAVTAVAPRTFAAPKGVPEYYAAGLGRVRARPRHAAGRRRPRRLRPHRAAGLRGHRAVRARGRRVHRRRVQGDVHLRRPRRPVGHPAPGGHRRASCGP